jgi:hypothetical protein
VFSLQQVIEWNERMDLALRRWKNREKFMKNTLKVILPVVLLGTALATPDVAFARHHYRHVYHGRATRCSGGNGAVGTVGGGVGGAVIGNAVIGGPVATIAGGVGGALLGRHLDKQHTRHRAGC